MVYLALLQVHRPGTELLCVCMYIQLVFMYIHNEIVRKSQKLLYDPITHMHSYQDYTCI